MQLGPGAKIAKADVSMAHRNVVMHPRDRWLLGIKWEGTVLIDRAKLFGQKSAPLLFTALDNAVDWVTKT